MVATFIIHDRPAQQSKVHALGRIARTHTPTALAPCAAVGVSLPARLSGRRHGGQPHVSASTVSLPQEHAASCLAGPILPPRWRRATLWSPRAASAGGGMVASRSDGCQRTPSTGCAEFSTTGQGVAPQHRHAQPHLSSPPRWRRATRLHTGCLRGPQAGSASQRTRSGVGPSCVVNSGRIARSDMVDSRRHCSQMPPETEVRYCRIMTQVVSCGDGTGKGPIASDGSTPLLAHRSV